MQHKHDKIAHKDTHPPTVGTIAIPAGRRYDHEAAGSWGCSQFIVWGREEGQYSKSWFYFTLALGF